MDKIVNQKRPKNINPKWGRLDTILIVICMIISFSICWYFHDKGWLRRDAGHFGYISQRMLAGDIIHKDIQVLHPGLINFINTFFLKLSEGDLVGLRYPLIALTVVQSGIGYKLARKNGYLTALTAALVLTAFGFLQFINPTPNWYAMFFAIVLAFLLDTEDQESTRKLLFIGFIVGIVFLLRQLSGIFLAMAVTTIIFLKNSTHHYGEPKAIAGRNILAILVIGLTIFLTFSGHILGFLLIGMFPILVLLIAISRTNLNFNKTIKVIAPLILGAIVAAIPLTFYHLSKGSFSHWVTDATIANVNLANMPVFDLYYYGTLPLFALIAALFGNLGAVGGFVFWSSLLISPAILGFATIKHLKANVPKVPVVQLIACFYALVSVIFEAPIYLLYSSGIVLLALLCIDGLYHKRKLIAVSIILSLIAIAFQAGENKHTAKFTATNSRLLVTTHYVPGHSIKVGPEDALKYQKLIKLINTCTRNTDKIFAMPIHPEVYFLSRRQSAFRFLNSGLGLQTSKDVEEQINYVLNSNSPALILHNEVDVDNNSELGQRLLQGVAQKFSYLGKIEEFTIYHRSTHPLRKECSEFSFDASN